MWILHNLSTLIVSSLLVIVVILIIKHIRKNKDTCSSNCAGCALSTTCHEPKKDIVTAYYAEDEK